MRHVQTEIGSVQEEMSLLLTIIKDNVKAAGQCDDKFIIALECMPIPIATSRHVIKPVRALNAEGNMRQFFDKGKVSPVILDLGQIDDTCRKLHTSAKLMINLQS